MPAPRLKMQVVRNQIELGVDPEVRGFPPRWQLQQRPSEYAQKAIGVQQDQQADRRGGVAH